MARNRKRAKGRPRPQRPQGSQPTAPEQPEVGAADGEEPVDGSPSPLEFDNAGSEPVAEDSITADIDASEDAPAAADDAATDDDSDEADAGVPVVLAKDETNAAEPVMIEERDGAPVDDDEVDEFLEEHPEDAADTASYDDVDDVEADADTDYEDDEDEDDEPAAVSRPVATAVTSNRRRRERSESSEHATDVAHPRQSLPARLVNFLQGSWRELQRVQWPDRRQVMQATGVVVGFVIVAGAFLGVADYLSTKLINFILK